MQFKDHVHRHSQRVMLRFHHAQEQVGRQPGSQRARADHQHLARGLHDLEGLFLDVYVLVQVGGRAYFLVVDRDGLRSFHANLGEGIGALVLQFDVLLGHQPPDRLAIGPITEAGGLQQFIIKRGIIILLAEAADDVNRASWKSGEFKR